MSSSGEKKLLFEHILVFELVPNESGQVKPQVKYRFPDPDPGKRDPFIESITQFCFPDVDSVQPKAKMQPETFSFVLTEVNGDRRFGYCRRLLPKGNGKRYPECFCITSFYPCFKIFSAILDELIYRASVDIRAMTYFNEAILYEKFPNPGETMIVSVCSWDKPGQVDNHDFHRPHDNDSMLEYIEIEPLLRALDPGNLLMVFGSLLAERRIIFVSDSLPKLSACVQSAVALLYPMRWQHIFIPVLPVQLLSFCCAPMPFVVGILASSLPEVEDLPMEETLMVDLDGNRFLRVPFADYPPHDYELLDPHRMTGLLRAVADSRKLVEKKGKTLSKSALQHLLLEFLHFVISQIAHFRRFIDKGEDGTFEKKGFIAAQPKAGRRLAEILVGSQMFEQFCQQTVHDGLSAHVDDVIQGFFESEKERKHRVEQARQFVRTAAMDAPILFGGKAEGTAESADADDEADNYGVYPVLMQGFLKKLSGKAGLVTRNWGKHFFVLDTQSLRSFKNKNTKTPSIVFPLETIEAVRFTGRQLSLGIDPTLLCIEVIAGDSTIIIRGEDQAETEDWCVKLQATLKERMHFAVAAAASSSSSSSSSQWARKFSTPIQPSSQLKGASSSNSSPPGPSRKDGNGEKTRKIVPLARLQVNPLAASDPGVYDRKIISRSADFRTLQKNLGKQSSLLKKNKRGGFSPVKNAKKEKDKDKDKDKGKDKAKPQLVLPGHPGQLTPVGNKGCSPARPRAVVLPVRQRSPGNRPAVMTSLRSNDFGGGAVPAKPSHVNLQARAGSPAHAASVAPEKPARPDKPARPMQMRVNAYGGQQHQQQNNSKQSEPEPKRPSPLTRQGSAGGSPARRPVALAVRGRHSAGRPLPRMHSTPGNLAAASTQAAVKKQQQQQTRSGPPPVAHRFPKNSGASNLNVQNGRQLPQPQANARPPAVRQLPQPTTTTRPSGRQLPKQPLSPTSQSPSRQLPRQPLANATTTTSPLSSSPSPSSPSPSSPSNQSPHRFAPAAYGGKVSALAKSFQH